MCSGKAWTRFILQCRSSRKSRHLFTSRSTGPWFRKCRRPTRLISYFQRSINPTTISSRNLRRLEQQLQPKLNVPRISGRRDPSERRRAQEVIGQVEVWMIEEVEDLSTELQVQALG